MVKQKNPILAGLLNILIPGAGCLYLGKWAYALIYFIWLPFSFFAAILVSWVFTYYLSGETKQFAFRLGFWLLWGLAIWDGFSTPYRWAKKYNLSELKQDKINSPHPNRPDPCK